MDSEREVFIVSFDVEDVDEHSSNTEEYIYFFLGFTSFVIMNIEALLICPELVFSFSLGLIIAFVLSRRKILTPENSSHGRLRVLFMLCLAVNVETIIITSIIYLEGLGSDVSFILPFLRLAFVLWPIASLTMIIRSVLQ